MNRSLAALLSLTMRSARRERFIRRVTTLAVIVLAGIIALQVYWLSFELAMKKNSVFNRRDILLKLWGDDNFFNGRSMVVYIAKLRKYLSHDPSISIINVWGYGYKLAVE